MLLGFINEECAYKKTHICLQQPINMQLSFLPAQTNQLTLVLYRLVLGIPS